MARYADLVARFLFQDKASGNLLKAALTADKAADSYKHLGKMAATALSGVSATVFARQSVMAYAEAEKAQTKLADAFARFPKLADTNQEALQKLNTELQRKTIYDDDATAAMQAQLAQFGLTGAQIAQTTPLVQDLASALGVSMGEAATTVGKALMGQSRGLRALGVDFKATGNRAADLTRLQDILNAKVGGFAEREGKTASGQAQILANQYGDLQESIGQALLPALTTLNDVLTPVLSAFNALPQPLKVATVAVGAFGIAAAIAAPRVMALRTAIEAGGGLAGKFGKLGTAAKTAATGLSVFAVGAAVAIPLSSQIGDNFYGTTIRGAELEQQLLKIGAGQAVSNLGQFGQGLGDLKTELEDLTDPKITTRVAGFFGTLAGNGGDERRKRVVEQIGAIDESLAALAAQSAPQAQAAFNNLASRFNLTADEVAALRTQMPMFKDAMLRAKSAAGGLAGATDALGNSAIDAYAKYEALLQQLNQMKNLDAETRREITRGQKPVDLDVRSQALSEIATQQAQERAKRYEDARQRQQDAAKEAADARKAAREKAAAERKSAIDSAASFASGLASQAQGFAKLILLTDRLTAARSAATEATTRLKQAQNDAADARRVLSQLAGDMSPDAIKQRVDARRALTNAENDARKASKDRAKAQADERKATPTGRNILADVRRRLGNIKAFANAVTRLRSLGLNNRMLQDIINAGPEDGLLLARALESSGVVREANRLQAQIDVQAGRIGAVGAQSQFAGGGNTATVNVYLDGKVIQTALVSLKRAQGGRLNFA